MLSTRQWLGMDEGHLVMVPGNAPHRLQPEAASAFVAMQQAAADDGIELAIASSYRPFARQLLIWNGKFNGERPVLDAQCQPLDVSTLDEAARIQAILRWSALPGTSRHHWGSDLDIYSPALLPEGASLQLEPWEYDEGGYFAPLSHWLEQHMAEFGFFQPFSLSPQGAGPAREPWHLSHAPSAAMAEQALTREALREALASEPLAGKNTLLAQLEEIWCRYVQPHAQGEPN